MIRKTISCPAGLMLGLVIFTVAACSSDSSGPNGPGTDADMSGLDQGSDMAVPDGGSDMDALDSGSDTGPGPDGGVDMGTDAGITIPDFACNPVDVDGEPRLTGPRSIRNLRVGIIPLQLSGQSVADLPSRTRIGEKYGNCDMQRLFYDGSNGEAAFEVEVAPWQSISVSEADLIDDFVIEDAELSGVDITLPDFSGETHFLIFLTFFTGDNGLPGSWTFRDYDGADFPRLSLNGELVPHMMMLTSTPDGLDEKRSFGYVFFDPRTATHGSLNGLVENEGRPVGQSQTTFAHEMVHYLGQGPHANSWDKGERFFFEPPDADAELKDNYGNHFAILGTSSGLSPVIHSVYRRLVGWGTRLMQELSANEDRRVTIAPINRLEGVTSVYFEASSNRTIQLEVREDDGWHDFVAASPKLSGNLDGLMVHVQEGQPPNLVSFLVDASPVPRTTTLFPGQDSNALEDVVLKPGMELHMPQMSLTDVRAEADNHFSVRIQTFATPREILHRPVRPTLSVAGNSATLTWAGSTHSDTTGFEVEVVAADGTSVMNSVTGAGETTATVDVSTIIGGGELHARIRAVGGGHPANWSRKAYVIP